MPLCWYPATSLRSSTTNIEFNIEMRALIIGASGFIGQYPAMRLLKPPAYEVSGTYYSRIPEDRGDPCHLVELTDHERLDEIFRLVQPEVVVHLAAIADVGAAESDPARATAVNVSATARIAQLCTRHQARMIFLSSEYVFGGERGNYREDDIPQPNTHYGRTKWEAELAVAREASHWSIVRTSLVYGWPLIGRQNLASAIIDRLETGDQFYASKESYRTPIYVEHLTRGIKQLLAGNHQGICHLAGVNWLSMYQFARAVAQVFNLDSSLVLPSQASMPFESDEVAKPDMLGLNCTQTIQQLGLRNFDIVAGLGEMLASRA